MNIKFLIVKISLLLIFILPVANVQAQFKTLHDVNGSPILAKSYVDFDGSPFFIDTWVKGTVKFTDGTLVKDIELKYDQVEDILLYKSDKGEMMLFGEPVVEFKLNYISNNQPYESYFRSGFPQIKGSSATAYYEVVQDGKVQLLKKTKKKVNEVKEYNSANIKRLIIENSSLFLYKAGNLTPIKKDKKSVVAGLADKTPEVEGYIEQNNLNLKQEAAIIKLVHYYNTL